MFDATTCNLEIGSLRIMYTLEMSARRRVLCSVYFAVAILALLAMWRQNFQFFAAGGLSPGAGFFAFWPALLANHATTSITVDIFMLGLAAFVWLFHEARRLSMRFVWIYVAMATVIGISFAFPLFLVARERRMHVVEKQQSEPPELSLLDRVGLALIGVAFASGTIWTMFR